MSPRGIPNYEAYDDFPPSERQVEQVVHEAKQLVEQGAKEEVSQIYRSEIGRLAIGVETLCVYGDVTPIQTIQIGYELHDEADTELLVRIASDDIPSAMLNGNFLPYSTDEENVEHITGFAVEVGLAALHRAALRRPLTDKMQNSTDLLRDLLHDADVDSVCAQVRHRSGVNIDNVGELLEKISKYMEHVPTMFSVYKRSWDAGNLMSGLAIEIELTRSMVRELDEESFSEEVAIILGLSGRNTFGKSYEALHATVGQPPHIERWRERSGEQSRKFQGLATAGDVARFLIVMDLAKSSLEE